MPPGVADETVRSVLILVIGGFSIGVLGHLFQVRSMILAGILMVFTGMMIVPLFLSTV